MVSRTLSSPIPNDPTDWVTDTQFYERESTHYAPRGRVRPEAEQIAYKNRTGTIARLFSAAEPRTPRYKPAAKDHVKDNVRRMREIQAKCKQRQEEQATQPVKPLYKPDKYEHIPPKVTMYMKPVIPKLTIPESPRQPKVSSTDRAPAPRKPYEYPASYLRSSHKENDQQLVHSQTSHGRPSSAPLPEKRKNYIAANIKHASKHKIHRCPSVERLNVLEAKKAMEYAGYQRGVVPQYLQERQESWRRAEEERIASLPDPSIPPGHALMPKTERLNTLELLHTKHSEMSRQLQSLPIRCDTLRVQNKRTELENKLAEIDDAIRIFSRPKVFVKLAT